MLTKTAPVLHLDWVQMHVKWVDKFHPEFHRNYVVKTLDFTTRHFRCVQEAFLKDKRICTITSKPHSGILDPDAILIKFDNWVCYDRNFKQIITEFISLNKLYFVQFSRLDFCADFNRFDNGMHPEKFISKYVGRRCLKTGKARKVRHTFSQGEDRHIGEGLKFGSNLSEITYYLYNKSLEMKEIKWKPYIYQSWKSGGLDVTQDVWRLEFSLKSGSKLLCDKKTGEFEAFTTIQVLEAEMVHRCFFVLYDNYFQFVWNDGQKRRDRMRELLLLKHVKTGLKLVNAREMIDATRSTKIFIKKLHELNAELRGTDIVMNSEMEHFKQTLIEKASLQSWAMYKGIN